MTYVRAGAEEDRERKEWRNTRKATGVARCVWRLQIWIPGDSGMISYDTLVYVSNLVLQILAPSLFESEGFSFLADRSGNRLKTNARDGVRHEALS
jgi:hypothetical protein